MVHNCQIFHRVGARCQAGPYCTQGVNGVGLLPYILDVKDTAFYPTPHFISQLIDAWRTRKHTGAVSCLTLGQYVWANRQIIDLVSQRLRSVQ